MTRKAIAALACGLCAGIGGSAVADTVNVEVYGTLLPFLDSVKSSGATSTPLAAGPSQVPNAAYTGAGLPARGRITSGTSNIGFRGNVAIAGDWKAIFQVEAAVPVDGDQGPQGLFASRNSHVGVAGPFGTLFFGVWDTPYKWTTIAIAPVRGLNPFDYDNILENPGFGVPGTTTQSGRVGAKPDAAFSRRQGNSVQYWTPNVFGFNGRVAYSVNESKANLPGGGTTSPDVISASIGYEQKLFMIRYAWEQHDDYFGMSQAGGSAGASATNRSSKDTGHKLMAGVFLPTDTKIFGVVERLIYDTDDTAAAAVKYYRRDAWFAEVVQRLGAAGVWGGLGQALAGACSRVNGSPCSTNQLGAILWSVGAMYDFGKRTTAYASYYGVATEDAATYSIFPAPGAVAPGADTRGFGLGLLHTF